MHICGDFFKQTCNSCIKMIQDDVGGFNLSFGDSHTIFRSLMLVFTQVLVYKKKLLYSKV